MRSTQRPQVTVLLHGKPLSDVKVEIYKLNQYPQKNSKPGFVRFTNSNGQATLPRLIPGQYRVSASAKPDLKADLYLEFIPEDPDQTSQLSIELRPYTPYTREPILAAAEKSPITNGFSKFQGTVRDQAGGLIPGASIDIVQLRTEGKWQTTRVRSDAYGRFSANLVDGDYVAFFTLSGFKERIVPLTISKTESAGELQVILQIGDVTE